MPAYRPTDFDAVVVGAGPAGSSAAIWLARAGWRVALVERQNFPRRKVCGECIAASNLPLLHALGIGPALEAQAGPALRQVRFLHGDVAISADLPPAHDPAHRWGRALGRETLDTLLLAQALSSGATVLQPWSVQAINGQAGAWRCTVRALDTGVSLVLSTPLLIDAHGSWESGPGALANPPALHRDSDLLAFKANFSAAQINPSAISVLALDGGYGGMVQEAAGIATLACCIRRDRLHGVRSASPGLRAGDAVQAWLQAGCAGVGAALDGAKRVGAWLSSGPLNPGVRLHAEDPIFRVGNAAGEAHPILGEGISMALQSSALLCAVLCTQSNLGSSQTAGSPVVDPATQALLQRQYVAAWRGHFAPRLRLAAGFAHLAMRPRSAALLMGVLQRWPGLLTQGARWGGKVRPLSAPFGTAAGAHAGLNV